MLLLAFLAARHFATTSWPLSRGQPGLLVAAGLLLLLAQALKAFGWGRLFTNRERPSPVALVAGNGGAALIGVGLPRRLVDARAVAFPGAEGGARSALGVVAAAGIAAAAVIVALPRLTGSERASR